MRKIPIHLQLYSISEDLEKDYFGVLEKVKAMGYDGVEFAGIFGGNPAWKIREKAVELELEIVSAHVSFDMMMAEKQETIQFYKELGCKYIVIPWIEISRLPGGDGFPMFKDQIIKTAESLSGHGMELLYHNHNFEFGMHDGKYILDELYDSIPADLLKAQLDTCWIRVGGENPVKYIGKYAGRLPIVHLKDYTADREATTDERLFDLIGEDSAVGEKRQALNFDFRPVGHGKMDFPPVIKAAINAGAQYFVVEQDKSTERPALEAVKMSIDYLRGLSL